MSEQQPPPGFDPTTNPKAAAKAAKAYAKASRPWFKKKRWWLLGAIVVIVVIIVAANAGGGGGPTKVTDNSGSSTSAKGDGTDGTKSNPVKVGETVQLEGTRYTVKKVVKKARVGGPYGEKADGVFVVVTLTIENMKDETKTFVDSAAKLVAADGNEYATDDDGQIYAQNSLVLEDMQPKLPKTGVLVFDVPPAKTAGAKLKLSDLFGGGDAYVDLGLT